MHALLVFDFPDGSARGGCMPMTVTAGLPGDQPFRVGFFETEVAGSGDLWRAAGWSATAVAAQLNSFDPRTMHVSFDVYGRVDGPSAGALMTVGVLAAARGDSVRDDTAMTGTVNPDGTIGPVAGIAHKIEGAVQAGRKRILIPAAIQTDFDKNLKSEVDLFELGKRLGIEVLPVHDVHAAYQLLTGKELPRRGEAKRPQPLTEQDEFFKTQNANWLQLRQQSVDEFSSFAEDFQNEYALGLIDSSDDLAASCRGLTSEGRLIAANDDAVFSALYARWAVNNAQSLQIIETDGQQALIDHILKQTDLADRLKEVAGELCKSAPKTIDQLPVYLSAHEAFLEAISLKRLAEITLASLPPDEELARDLVFTAAERYESARFDLLVAEEQIAWAKQLGGPQLPADARLDDAANFFRHAGEATLNVFDQLIVDEIAKSLGIHFDQAKNRLVLRDEIYGLVKTTSEFSRFTLPTCFQDQKSLSLAQLAAGLSQYTYASSLLAKYYNFGASLDKDLNIESIGRQAALQDAIDSAQTEAERRINELEQLGVDGSLSKAYYQVARVARGRDNYQSFRALSFFWYASLYADLVTQLMKADSTPATPDE